MNIDFLNEKQNSSTLLVIFVVKSIEIEILNNGTAKRKLKKTSIFDFIIVCQNLKCL